MLWVFMNKYFFVNQFPNINKPKLGPNDKVLILMIMQQLYYFIIYTYNFG